MLRDKSLIPLSHQHQHALALCVRIDRAQPIRDTDIEAWLSEIEQQFEPEIRNHFTAEESVVFPAALNFSELRPLVAELISDHESLRQLLSQARERKLTASSLPRFAEQLSTHIRKEERLLFERMQQLMSLEDLRILGRDLDLALAGTDPSCSIPSEATKLKPRK